MKVVNKIMMFVGYIFVAFYLIIFINNKIEKSKQDGETNEDPKL
jgi:hypothetical protein